MTEQPLFGLPFEEILRRTAARTSYPGGGAASAMACAAAAALVAMAGRFTGETAAAAVARAETAIDELADCAQADAEAFGELLAAWRIPRDEPGRQERVAAAALSACEVPLRIGRVGVELAEHAAWLGREGKPDLQGDAYTAGQLAQAGVRGAAVLVELNARQTTDPAPAQEARRLVAAVAAAADRTTATPGGSQ